MMTIEGYNKQENINYYKYFIALSSHRFDGDAMYARRKPSRPNKLGMNVPASELRRSKPNALPRCIACIHRGQNCKAIHRMATTHKSLDADAKKVPTTDSSYAAVTSARGLSVSSFILDSTSKSIRSKESVDEEKSELLSGELGPLSSLSEPGSVRTERRDVVIHGHASVTLRRARPLGTRTGPPDVVEASSKPTPEWRRFRAPRAAYGCALETRLDFLDLVGTVGSVPSRATFSLSSRRVSTRVVAVVVTGEVALGTKADSAIACLCSSGEGRGAAMMDVDMFDCCGDAQRRRDAMSSLMGPRRGCGCTLK